MTTVGRVVDIISFTTTLSNREFSSKRAISQVFLQEVGGMGGRVKLGELGGNKTSFETAHGHMTALQLIAYISIHERSKLDLTITYRFHIEISILHSTEHSIKYNYQIPEQ